MGLVCWDTRGEFQPCMLPPPRDLVTSKFVLLFVNLNKRTNGINLVLGSYSPLFDRRHIGLFVINYTEKEKIFLYFLHFLIAVLCNEYTTNIYCSAARSFPRYEGYILLSLFRPRWEGKI